MNDDSIADAFVDYCIEATDKDRDVGGGNAMMNLQCMVEGFSVYIKVATEWVLKADKVKDDFTDEGLSYNAEKVIDNKIYCSNHSFADGDARCCPSLKRTMYLMYESEKIIKPEQIIQETKEEN